VNATNVTVVIKYVNFFLFGCVHNDAIILDSFGLSSYFVKNAGGLGRQIVRFDEDADSLIVWIRPGE
jgi:hypothetical protein